ncbi:hypothetical protein B0H10DRAFT_1799629, partial [Mycena sp. CBHHK59/15]
YSAIAGDGGPNVRAAKRIIVKMFPWILNIYDLCHNLNLMMKDLGKLFKKDLGLVSALSNYFGKSNIGTYHLTQERANMNIGEGMKSASETRFSTTYIQTLAVQTCMPAIKSCYRSGTLLFDTKAILGTTPAHYVFMSSLATIVQLMSSIANGILTLEGQNTTCADVFFVWVCIAWHLEKVLADPKSSAGGYRAAVIEIYNTRFEQMMTESSCNVFLLSYFLHPSTSRHSVRGTFNNADDISEYRKFGGLQLTMPTRLNGEQLKPSQYPPLFKILVKAALMILQGEQQRLNTGGKEEALQLTEELIRYAYNQGPFDSQYWDNSTKPLKFWQRLSNDSNAKQIGVKSQFSFICRPN